MVGRRELSGVGVHALGGFEGFVGGGKGGEFFGFGGVEGDPFLEVVGDFAFGVDGVDGAFADAGVAVNAGVGVDVEAVGGLVKGFDGADGDAEGVFAVHAGGGDDVGHEGDNRRGGEECKTEDF